VVEFTKTDFRFLCRFAAFVYTPEGEAIREQLWKETMAEFEFAGVQEILDSMKK
jgi:hypothetical protein